MTNAMGPLPGNEKKAEARRRQRANKGPKPSIFKDISDSYDRGDDANFFLGVLMVLISFGAIGAMFVMFFAAL
jgi:hypothetical protein